MAELLTIPLKKPSDVDIVTPLKNLIQARYSTADKPEDYSDAINELSSLRSNAIWKAFEKYESSLEILYSYCDQLVSLEGKIPAQEVQVPFKWKDAFDKGSIFGARISLTVPSLSYEKICVLFNIAALQSSVAAAQSVESDESLKSAAKLLQQAAGIFNHLKSIVIVSIQQDPTPDLNPDTLGALSQLMLAQAQEMFVQKAIHDNMKDGIIAKLAAQCEDLYSECVKVFYRDNLKGLWDKEWLATINAKQAGYQAVAYLYQSLVCRANKMVGEEITWLTNAQEKFTLAHQKAGRALFEDFLNKTERNLTEARKDNDFIYHERIPDIRSLNPISKAPLAKLIPPVHPMSQNFRDLFDELVPVAVHQALAAYDVRKSDMVNGKIAKLREATQLLNTVLTSLNLPAAIESTEGGGLPQSILDKAEMVRSLGGIEALEALVESIPELLKRNQDIIDEAARMLDEERDADKQLKQQFKEKWTRTESDKLTGNFRANITKYRELIRTAVQADKTVQEKFNQHKPSMTLLSKSADQLQQAVPSGESTNVSGSNAAAKLRNLMEDVETIKAERDVIEKELNSTMLDMKDKFMAALASDGVINEPVLSIESLGKTYGSLNSQVDENVKRQEGLIEQIRVAHTEFVAETGQTNGGREAMLCKLAAAHDAYRDLQNNLKEGTKFYNDLTQLLVAFQNKVMDYCFARKTEKEELMKDLTREYSRPAQDPTPSPPTYHKESPTTPQPSPSQPTPPPQQQPQNVPTNLPYPVYVQGMPIPYAASSNTPYPSYAPPPMPQGYNPYGTLPYPSQYNFPGGFPQQPQQQHYHTMPPGGYHQPPGGYQPPPPGGYQ